MMLINLSKLTNEDQALTIQVRGYCGFSSFDEKNFDGQLGRKKLSQTLLPITFKNSVLKQSSKPHTSNTLAHKDDQPPSYEESFSHPPAGENLKR